MAKQLKDILAGVKSSKKEPASLGKDAGVDYKPKAGDEAKFADKHEIEKHDDRVGNGDDVYKGKTSYDLNFSSEKRHGHKKGDDKKVYEAKKAEDAQCNMTKEGVECPVHGMNECWSAKTIKEEKPEETSPAMKGKIAAGHKGKSPAEQGKIAAYLDDLEREKQKKQNMKKEEVELDEVLTKSTTAGETIHDFVHSKNPKFAGKSKEKRKQMALAAYYKKQNEETIVSEEVKEDLAVPLLGGDKPRGDADGAADMVKSELRALANKAMHLAMAMPEGMHIEPWVQAKIAQAKSYVSDVHDYMIYGDHKDEEDEQTDTPMTFPGMNVDHAGMNV